MRAKNVIVYGAGGHSKVVADALGTQHTPIMAFADDAIELGQQGNYRGIPIWNPYDDRLLTADAKWIVAIGNNANRKSIVQRLGNSRFDFFSCVHPSTEVSSQSPLGIGVMVLAGAIVNADTKVGDHVILNSGSIVEHDCVVDNYVHIAPGAKLGGGVHVGEGTLIGIGATVIPQARIGEWCVIGAGSVVVQDIPDGSVVVGVPGRIIKNNQG